VTEQPDQFQKFGKTLVRKYEFENIKKSDLDKKNLIFLYIFFKIMTFLTCFCLTSDFCTF